MSKIIMVLCVCCVLLVLCGTAFGADEKSDVGGGGIGVSLVPVPPVPEPGSLAVLAGAIGGLAVIAKYQRRR